MDPISSAQDILFCDLCETKAVQSYCDICQLQICKNCVGEHLSDSSKEHNIMPYKQWKYNPQYAKCSKHDRKECKLYCEKCDTPICLKCYTSKEHVEHEKAESLVVFERNKKALEEELQELESSIYPKYEEKMNYFLSENIKIEKGYEKLNAAVINQGEEWHNKIEAIVNELKSRLDTMKKKSITALQKNEENFKQPMSDLKDNIINLKEILESNDMSLVFTYKSRMEEFSKLPPYMKITLPSFSTKIIDINLLFEEFGSLSSSSSVITKEY